MPTKNRDKKINILKQRKAIALEAAKLLYDQVENDYFRAKQKAARFLDIDEKTFPLPSDQEIRMEVLKIANLQQDYLRNKAEEITEESDYDAFYGLLLPLEEVKGGYRHPEGDYLYHSLQVFELAQVGHGYDFDFLLAALLHDVGMGIDRTRHEEAGVYALEGMVSERVLFLIEHHNEVATLKNNQLGQKKKMILKSSPYLEDLLLLHKLNLKGRESGISVCTLEEALQYLRDLEKESAF